MSKAGRSTALEAPRADTTAVAALHLLQAVADAGEVIRLQGDMLRVSAPAPLGGQSPALEQERDLVLAPGERGEGRAAAVQGIEAALGLALAGHAEGPHWDALAVTDRRRTTLEADGFSNL